MANAVRLVDEASVLPVEERIFVVDSLLRTLNFVNDEIDAAWGTVAEQRLDDLLSGRVQSVPAEEVFEKAKRLTTK